MHAVDMEEETQMGEELMQKHCAAQSKQNLPEKFNGAKARKAGVIKDTDVEEVLQPRQSC